MKLFLKDCKLSGKEEERKLHLDDFYCTFSKIPSIEFSKHFVVILFILKRTDEKYEKLKLKLN